MRRRKSPPLKRAGLALILALLPRSAEAFQSRLVDATGKPLAAAQISVVGQRGSWRTAGDGAFEILPDPPFPATIIVVGAGGELYPPITIDGPQAELALEAAWRETVTVSVGSAPNIEGTPASAAAVIGAEEIEQRKPSHVSTAIAATPGVALRGEGAPAVPVVRGLAGGRTLLLIDDARIVSERRAGPSASFIDPSSLGSIEIVRGPGSVAYGSDALGGIVHLRPRDPDGQTTDVRYDASWTFGGSDARSVGASLTSRALGGALLASLHARAADHARDATGDTISNSQYRDRGALLRFVRDTTGTRVRAGLMTSVARDVGAPSSESVLTIYPDERATLLTLAIDREAARGWTAFALRASAGASLVTTERRRASGVETSAVKARDAALRISAERAGSQSRLVVGGDVVTRFGLRASGAIEDASRVNAGVWSSWESRLSERLGLAVGARADRVEVVNEDGWIGDRRLVHHALSGFGAFTAGPWRNTTATLQLARGYREPSLSDRFYRGVSGRGFVIGNPDLRPEESIQVDASLRWARGRSNAALFAYDYEISDLVERYRDGNDFRFRNRGEARIRGLELELSAPLHTALELQVGAAVSTGEADGETPLDDIAPPVAHVSLRWAAEARSAFITGSWWARDARPGPVEVERPGYATIELGAGWRLHPALELRVTVRNALDRRYAASTDAAAAAAPGRSVTVGINR